MNKKPQGVLARHAENQEAPQAETAESSDMQAAERSQGMDGGEDDIDDESMKNPAYRKARELMLSKLYEEGAAQGVAQAIAQAQSVVQGLVDQSMSLGQVMDDVTQGSVPDDLVLSFMLDITQEVVDIANASGIKVQPADMAQAVQEVLAQTIEAFGGDASQVRQEMGSIDPNEVGAAAMQHGGMNG